MFQWQAYLWPLLIATESDMLVGSIAIARMFGEDTTDYGAIFAGSFLLDIAGRSDFPVGAGIGTLRLCQLLGTFFW